MPVCGSLPLVARWWLAAIRLDCVCSFVCRSCELDRAVVTPLKLEYILSQTPRELWTAVSVRAGSTYIVPHAIRGCYAVPWHTHACLYSSRADCLTVLAFRRQATEQTPLQLALNSGLSMHAYIIQLAMKRGELAGRAGPATVPRPGSPSSPSTASRDKSSTLQSRIDTFVNAFEWTKLKNGPGMCRWCRKWALLNVYVRVVWCGVCVCVRVCACECARICVYVRVCACMYLYARACACMCVHVRACACMCVSVHVCAYECVGL